MKLVGEWDEGIGRVGCWELGRGGRGEGDRPGGPPDPPARPAHA